MGDVFPFVSTPNKKPPVAGFPPTSIGLSSISLSLAEKQLALNSSVRLGQLTKTRTSSSRDCVGRAFFVSTGEWCELYAFRIG